MKARLDDPERHAAVDGRGFRELLRGFPGQVAEAIRLADGIRLDGGRPRAVLMLGMGGSAVAGDFLQGLCHERAPFPVQVVRGYGVPAWVGSDTLAVASSYSGQTEETLAAFDAARQRGARALVVSSGGELGERARREQLPWVRLPEGFPPRAALAYLLMPVLALLETLGASLGGEGEREEAIRVLKALGGELAPEVPAAENPAKALAASLAGRIPVIYGADPAGAVAYRWRTQLEENAKVLAGSGVLPEMNHNAIEAWAGGTGGEWAVVFLRDRAEHPRVARRAALTRALLESRAPTHEVWARGEGPLARLLSLVLWGDWVSYYLAVLRGVDPWAMEAIETFKRRMAEPAV
ncbi:MAG TPA: bifunctional phosphoglucose/phosphomannose isomerase [Methylomirabilota bacterium]|nr:bifunctional phosphoglucose/phosphomannose isomerase [Methylomirabilota bacterium]